MRERNRTGRHPVTVARCGETLPPALAAGRADGALQPQVEDTPATRGRQGNVFVTILGAKFNAHIDIKGKKK